MVRTFLAWDASWRRLYVAAESGVLSAFWLDGSTLRPIGEIRAPHAHTVSVDPRTHRVYLPLENIGRSARASDLRADRVTLLRLRVMPLALLLAAAIDAHAQSGASGVALRISSVPATTAAYESMAC